MSTLRQDGMPAGPVVAGERPRRRLELAEIGIRLLDAAHVAWQRAELECEEALQVWYEGPPRASVGLYLTYRAALDREHAAAHDLERLWELALGGHEALAAAASSPADVRAS